MKLENQKEIVNDFLRKGILMSPDLIDKKIDDNLFKLMDDELVREKFLLLNKDFVDSFSGSFSDINLEEFEKSKVLFEKGKDEKIYKKFISMFSNKLLKLKEKKEEISFDSEVDIVNSYNIGFEKIEFKNFVSYFKHRYEVLSELLRKRMNNLISIDRIKGKDRGEKVSLIGLVYDKRTSKNDNCILTLEDPTGKVNVVINKNREEVNGFVDEIVLDEVIGVTGVLGDGILFVNELFFPDVPHRELRKSSEDEYAVFISDIHVGSNMFLEDSFLKFLNWIKGESGSFIQKKIAKKVKYLFIIGDLVDGVGIYPGQDKELTIKDVEGQYKKCAEFLKEVPENIKIIICPGNHDALRIAEPQPVLDEKYAKPLWDLPNVVLVSNPSLVNISKNSKFEGFDVLLYHGYCFDYYVSEVEKIRNNGGYDSIDLVMRLLLRKRHLAPTHGSTLYVPSKIDPLVIEKVPDFFVTGHIHKAKIGNYNGVTMICSSCWQGKTEFQEKVGHDPEPSRVPVVNLQTREVKMFKF